MKLMKSLTDQPKMRADKLLSDVFSAELDIHAIHIVAALPVTRQYPIFF
jgi:hypothetical protein